MEGRREEEAIKEEMEGKKKEGRKKVRKKQITTIALKPESWH